MKKNKKQGCRRIRTKRIKKGKSGERKQRGIKKIKGE